MLRRTLKKSWTMIKRTDTRTVGVAHGERYHSEDESKLFMSDSTVRIPIPIARRWRLFRYQLLSFIVFGAAVVMIVYLWSRFGGPVGQRIMRQRAEGGEVVMDSRI